MSTAVATRAAGKHDGGSKSRAAVGKKAVAQDLTTYSGRLGAVIRALRVKRGLDVERFQDALRSHGCEVSPQTIYAWEAGTRPIGLNDLPAIAATLGTTIKKLLPES